MQSTDYIVYEFMNGLRQRSRMCFTFAELVAGTGANPKSLNTVLSRLQAEKQIASPRRGFYIAVDQEFRSHGSPPPSHFVDQMMKSWNQPYYVGLLSAVELYGGSPNRSNLFQVVTDKPLRSLESGSYKIKFYTKKRIALTPVVPVTTETGQLSVSSLEATLLDLVKYANQLGQLTNVSMLISELSSKISSSGLAGAISGVELPVVQRLGYILDCLGLKSPAGVLHELIKVKKPRAVFLSPNFSRVKDVFDDRWQLYINGEVVLKSGIQ